MKATFLKDILATSNLAYFCDGVNLLLKNVNKEGKVKAINSILALLENHESDVKNFAQYADSAGEVKLTLESDNTFVIG